MKKILLLLPYLPYPLERGGNIRVWNLSKILSKKYNIHLLSFIENEEQKRFLPELLTIFKKIDVVLRKPDYINNRWLYNINPSYIWAFFSFEMKQKLEYILKSEQIDLIQIEYIIMANYINYVDSNIPCILVEHDLAEIILGKSILSKNEVYQKGFGKILAFLEWMRTLRFELKICKNFKKIITLSEKDKNILRNFMPDINASVVPTGTDFEYFKSTWSDTDSQNLVFVGHYPHYPNEDAVIYFAKEILPIIHKNKKDVKFYIVGSHPTNKIKSLASDKIIVTGEVPDVREYLRKATIFVAPIRLGSGLKGKVVEAMAHSIPVVGTSTAFSGIDGVNGKDFIIANSKEEFAKAVICLLEDKILRKKIADNVFELIKNKYDWKILAGKIDEIYEEIIKNEENMHN